MKFLFDSKGNHIANEVNGQLHAPTGENIGHFIKTDGFLIDMDGNYLGEIVNGDRLLHNDMSPYKNVNYGVYGNYGSTGNYGNPGNHGSIGTMPGYTDIPRSRLR